MDENILFVMIKNNKSQQLIKNNFFVDSFWEFSVNSISSKHFHTIKICFDII